MSHTSNENVGNHPQSKFVLLNTRLILKLSSKTPNQCTVLDHGIPMKMNQSQTYGGQVSCFGYTHIHRFPINQHAFPISLTKLSLRSLALVYNETQLRRVNHKPIRNKFTIWIHIRGIVQKNVCFTLPVKMLETVHSQRFVLLNTRLTLKLASRTPNQCTILDRGSPNQNEQSQTYEGTKFMVQVRSYASIPQGFTRIAKFYKKQAPQFGHTRGIAYIYLSCSFGENTINHPYQIDTKISFEKPPNQCTVMDRSSPNQNELITNLRKNKFLVQESTLMCNNSP